MNLVKTITVEGYSDDDCNRKIINALNVTDIDAKLGTGEYKIGKFHLIKLVRDAMKDCPNQSLMEIKLFVEKNIGHYIS